MPKTPTKAAAAVRPARAKATSKADRTHDASVVGGGHNGLTNASYLAKAGVLPAEGTRVGVGGDSGLVVGHQ
jgi:ribulose 1,5-bisphosphate synthetase/thiazole synthase